MKFKIIKILIISICINMILFNGITATKKNSKKSFTIIHAQETTIKAVIFDVGNVLVSSSSYQQTCAILQMALHQPSLMYTLATKDLQAELFAMLHNVPAQTKICDQVMYNHGKQMPQIMVDWQIGRPATEICACTLAYLATSPYSANQRAVFSKIIQMIFQPKQLIEILHPIKPMVQLAHTLKSRGYKLYVLSNWDPESFPLMQQKHQALFAIFDGIMISGTEGIGKPDPKFYTNLLQKYELDPTTCAFIDDEQHNVTAAYNLGIHGVLHDSFDSVCLQLKSIGIMQ